MNLIYELGKLSAIPVSQDDDRKDPESIFKVEDKMIPGLLTINPSFLERLFILGRSNQTPWSATAWRRFGLRQVVTAFDI